MASIDIVIIVGFILYALVSGLRSRKVASENLEEYFLAGRSLPGWKAGLSMAATQFAADTPLVVTGLIATAGIFAAWRFWIYGLAFLLMGFVLAASWRRARVLTDAELTELRYGKRPAAALRGAKAIYFGTIFNCTVLGMILLAATRIAEPFLTWHLWLPADIIQPLAGFLQAIHTPLTVVPADPAQWPANVWEVSASNMLSIIAILLVTVFYSTTGGLRSVVNTDVMQFALMMGGTAIYSWIVVDEVGPLSELPAKLQAALSRPDHPIDLSTTEVLAFTPSQANSAGIAILTVFAIQWIAQINADGTGYLAQRSMACRSDLDAKRAAVVFTVAQILVRSLLWLPIGVGLILLFPPDAGLTGAGLTAEREATFVEGIVQTLPPGVKGLMITGMLAALASTVDTHLNWGSSYWTNDIYKRFYCQAFRKREPGGRSLVWVARGSNVLILAIALVIMTQMKNIKDAWETSLLLGAGVGVLLVMRWVWWRLNAWGEIASILASIALLPILSAYVEHDAWQLLAMAFGATAAGIVTSLVTPAEEMSELQQFYKRARPPGFWKPVARTVGESGMANSLALRNGLIATFAGALSIFCLLTGIGSWLVGSPAPTWFPWRTGWILLLCAVGIGLIPLWWKLGLGAYSSLQVAAADKHEGRPRS